MKYDLLTALDSTRTLEEIIFNNRGIKKEEIDKYKNPVRSFLLDYELLNNITLAASKLLYHINNGSKIYVQVDSDCDGYTSSATLLNWIYRFNKDCFVDYGLHDGKEHGLDKDFIDDLLQSNYKLVIIPDAGSNQFDIHEVLYNNGIDCIVLDHHQSPSVSSFALIVNPQLDNYPNKNLSGAGVVYKFCQALDALTGNNYADDLLDVVSLGMIADMMDTRNLEMRYILKQGLSNIKNTFLKALIEKQSFSMRNEVNPTTIGFYIAPLINATVRAGSREEKLFIFQSFLDRFAEEKVLSKKRGAKDQQELMVVESLRILTNIRARQNKMRDSALEKIEHKIEEEKLYENKIMPIVISKDEEIDKNISGLIANKLMGKYKKPVLILREKGDGYLEGSARGYEKSELIDFKSFLLNSNLVEYAEGHPNAFGVKISSLNLPKLVDYSNECLKNVDFSQKFLVDFIFSPSTLDEATIIKLSSLNFLWSKGFEEPVFLIENLKIKKESIFLMSPEKNPTLKIEFKKISMIKFNCSEEEYKNLTSSALVSLNVIGRFSINEWQGEISPQVLIEDYEIKEFQKYYF
jgi:single-stranded-DNA-specific exonuclease